MLGITLILMIFSSSPRFVFSILLLNSVPYFQKNLTKRACLLLHYLNKGNVSKAKKAFKEFKKVENHSNQYYFWPSFGWPFLQAFRDLFKSFVTNCHMYKHKELFMDC